MTVIAQLPALAKLKYLESNVGLVRMNKNFTNNTHMLTIIGRL